jgi:hypothetical protein
MKLENWSSKPLLSRWDIPTTLRREFSIPGYQLEIYIFTRTKETFIDGCAIVGRIVQVLLIYCTHSWVRTGDEVKIGQNGELVVLDRLKAGIFFGSLYLSAKRPHSYRKS